MIRGKQVVFMVAIRERGLSGLDYLECCLPTWRYFCTKHSIELVVMTERDPALAQLRAPWHKLAVFRQLALRGLRADRVAIVDADTMVRWDCPNFFDEVPRGTLGVVVDDGSPATYSHDLRAYRSLLPRVELNWWDYFNTGMLVADSSHRQLFEHAVRFARRNLRQIRVLEKAVPQPLYEQTPLNLMVRQRRTRLHFMEPTYNFQQIEMRRVGEDFRRLSYIWHFNGFRRTASRRDLIRETWRLVEERYR